MKETDRLARYLAGEMTAGETAALEREAAADPVLVARLRAARAAWAGASADDAPAVDVDGAWRRFAAHAAITDRDTERQETPGLRSRDVLPLRREPPPAFRESVHRRGWLTGTRAAAGALLLVAGMLVWQVVRPGSETIATRPGEQRVHTLADGSEVRLGPLSRLVIRAGYGGRHRNVELDGEAFFAAVHGDAPALVVETRTATIRDIGTAFVVRAVAPDGTVDVVVTEGSVWLGHVGAATEDGVLLHAGQQGRLDPAAAQTRVLDADTGQALAWTRGRLVFVDATLDDVARQLHRWYGVDVTLARPQLAQRRITVTFEGAAVGAVLDVIARTLALTYRRDGDAVVFDAPVQTP